MEAAEDDGAETVERITPEERSKPVLHGTMTPEQFILLTIKEDTEEAPWIVMGDPQMRAISSFYPVLYYHMRAAHPDWYVASMLPIRFWRPRTHVVGQLGLEAFVAVAEDRPRQSYDLMAGENPPAFVLEVLSPVSVAGDLELKRGAYFELGVQEYALFDPTSSLVEPPLQGFRREEGKFVAWEPDAEGRLHSEVLGLWLIAQGPDIRLMRPDRTSVPIYQEMQRRVVQLEAAQRRVVELEAVQRRVAELEAEVARVRVEQERHSES